MIHTATTQPDVALEATRIDMAFGGVKALDAVSIELPVGCWTGLIGPNGSGKTTLLNVLSGVYVPSAGRMRIASTELAGKRSRSIALAGLARTFQHPQLAETLTIRENVLLGGDLRRRRGATRESRATISSRADELLATFGCADYGGHLPAEVPYGVSKTAEIARALLADPAVLLLDEPAAGLSGEERRDLLASFAVLRRHRPELAVCLVEHDVPLVSASCDRLQVLNFGRVIAHGSTSDVLDDESVKTAYLGGPGSVRPRPRRTDT